MTQMLLAVALIASSVSSSDWQPPANPDPHKILNEAERDARAGHYADALAKHVWFHENALKYLPSMHGVRLSFALSDWVELGRRYPPALEKLREIRNKAESDVRHAGPLHDVWEAFDDFESINKYLREDVKTRDLFIWLDTNNPSAARRCYQVAQSILVKTKEYRLCGKYIDPKQYDQEAHLYRLRKDHAKRPGYGGSRLLNFSEKSFSNKTAILVALLVLNDRQADADKIVENALKERNDPDFKELLEKARKGDVPKPYP